MSAGNRLYHSVLVANRGEIAVRIMRTAEALGYRTIAVHSDADTYAPHVLCADEAVLIGPAPVAESYLNVERIIEAAKSSGADAIHPGYGFLSENAAFARACGEAGLIFIGPSAKAIELMGDKARAKRYLLEAGVPCVPGYQDDDQSEQALLNAAAEIGFPVMVKAAAGGGGRGMRLVLAASELKGALKLARSEAENAFGNGHLILEKAIIRPRHVEIQVFGDRHGNVIHLGERDCSVQRRHQKVIEEAPCPVMTPQLREQMGAAAVRAASSVDYVGAGTVEFLLDTEGSFYFLEMNTRLQVEHPVTELITGLDLVALQLSVAGGEPLGLNQDEIELRGHAIEVRLYAEDPSNDFMPATGRIELWRSPEGPGVRVDSGIASGSEVSSYYDPMLAKVMAWGETRDIARQRLVAALDQTAVFGPATNRDFLIAALDKPTFADGEATTAFIDETFGTGSLDTTPASNAHYAAAAVLQFDAARREAQVNAIGVTDQLLNWTNAAAVVTPFDYSTDKVAALVTVTPVSGNEYRVCVNGEATSVLVERIEASSARLTVGDKKHDVIFQPCSHGQIHLCFSGCSLRLVDLTVLVRDDEHGEGGGAVIAAMHGLLLDVLVAPGAKVCRGDTVAIVEAMKMQHEIRADIDGTVARIEGRPNEQIAAGELILEIEPQTD